MTADDPGSPAAHAPFRVWRLAVVVLSILLGLTLANQWYARHTGAPSYCDDPVQTLERVRQLLAESGPAIDDARSRRPYIAAARLLFLLPRQGGEGAEDYLRRAQAHLTRECR